MSRSTACDAPNAYGRALVAIRVPHRGAGTVVPAKCPYVADATEAEWEQGRPLLQRRQSQWPNARHLHEEERSRFPRHPAENGRMTDIFAVGQRVPCAGARGWQDQRAHEGTTDLRIPPGSAVTAVRMVPRLPGKCPHHQRYGASY